VLRADASRLRRSAEPLLVIRENGQRASASGRTSDIIGSIRVMQLCFLGNLIARTVIHSPRAILAEFENIALAACPPASEELCRFAVGDLLGPAIICIALFLSLSLSLSFSLSLSLSSSSVISPLIFGYSSISSTPESPPNCELGAIYASTRLTLVLPFWYISLLVSGFLFEETLGLPSFSWYPSPLAPPPPARSFA